MKNTIIAVLVFFLIPSVSFANFDNNLKYGSKGDSVTELQEFLTNGGWYSGPVTGNFYSLTLAGVKRFQTANSLPITGYFGPMSRAVAVDLLAKDTTDSQDAEISEVGAVAIPVNADPATMLNQKVDMLTNAVQETNSRLGQVITNTTQSQQPQFQPIVYNVSIQRGSGSHAEYDDKCRPDGTDRTANVCSKLLDGDVLFIVDKHYNKAILGYYRDGDKLVAPNMDLPVPPDYVGFLQPNSTYHWRIDFTDNNGLKSTQTGDIVTGDYPR